MSDRPEQPQPDPALRRLERLVGRWNMEGNLVGSDEKNITGRDDVPLATGRLLPRAARAHRLHGLPDRRP